MYNRHHEKTTTSQKIFQLVSYSWPGTPGHWPGNQPDLIFMDRNCFCPSLAPHRWEIDASKKMKF